MGIYWLGYSGLTLCGLSVLAMLVLTLAVIYDGEQFEDFELEVPADWANAGGWGALDDRAFAHAWRRTTRTVTGFILLMLASVLFSQLAALLTKSDAPKDGPSVMTVWEAEQWRKQ